MANNGCFQQATKMNTKAIRGYVVVDRFGKWVSRVFGPASGAISFANGQTGDNSPYTVIEVTMTDEVKE